MALRLRLAIGLLVLSLPMFVVATFGVPLWVLLVAYIMLFAAIRFIFLEYKELRG